MFIIFLQSPSLFFTFTIRLVVVASTATFSLVLVVPARIICYQSRTTSLSLLSLSRSLAPIALALHIEFSRRLFSPTRYNRFSFVVRFFARDFLSIKDPSSASCASFTLAAVIVSPPSRRPPIRRQACGGYCGPPTLSRSGQCRSSVLRRLLVSFLTLLISLYTYVQLNPNMRFFHANAEWSENKFI